MALINEGGRPAMPPRVSPTVTQSMLSAQAAARPVDGRAFGTDRGFGVYRGRGGQLTYKGTPPATRPNPRPPGGTMPSAAAPAAPPPVSSAPPLASTNPVAPAPAQRPGPYPGTQMDASGFISFIGGKASDPSLLPLVKAQNMTLQQRTGKNPYVATPAEVEASWLYPKGYNLQSAINDLGFDRFGAAGWNNLLEQRRLGLAGAAGNRRYANTRKAAQAIFRRLRAQGRI